MDETRLHPIWKEAAVKIAQRVQSEGYGFLIEMDELHSVLEVKTAKDHTPWVDAKRSQFDFLEKVEELKKICLHEHNICLDNERGRGYRVLTPDDQVTKGWERRYEKVRKHIRKAIDVLVNVDQKQLTASGSNDRDRNLNRTVFIMSAANKRKIPVIERKKIA